MNSEFISWLFVACIVAIGVVLRSRYKLSKTPFEKLFPTLEKEVVSLDISLQTLKPFIENLGYKILYFDEKKDHMIIDSPSIGFFHWGFFYFLRLKDKKLSIGIYPKGPNPPKDRALENYLEKFMSKIKPFVVNLK